MALAGDRTPRSSPEDGPSGDAGGRPPAILLISIAGVVGVVTLAAAWLWVTRGPAILLDIAQAFCF